jgi:hypothetical protein
LDFRLSFLALVGAAGEDAKPQLGLATDFIVYEVRRSPIMSGPNTIPSAL